MYWEITPHKSPDFDSCVMPGNTEQDHQDALEYAKDVLEQGWDEVTPGDVVTVSIQIIDGVMPDVQELS